MLKSVLKISFVAFLVALPCLADDAPADAQAHGRLSLRFLGLHSDRGRIGCALFTSPKGFPSDRSSALQQHWCKVDQIQACAFEPVPASTYAIACYHDENGNGKLDTGTFGRPLEGVAFSNQTKAFFGPPGFADARFKFAGQDTELSLTMVY
jgi:uncharacterized protein (DUF2141 family)